MSFSGNLSEGHRLCAATREDGTLILNQWPIKNFPDKFFNSSPILAYNINEVMEEIEKLPICTDCTGSEG